ncbi:hypothetical protein LR48_Vigan118s001000 [Vigna angularis]|uniref:Uncharacterized protein n=1 Tax=Phaseolus angularis TaxID=3914 RepID=A0A0L9T4N3_PHAAN|nr:hypothetical protein LR48_Vigan118s001000 [Vigna angularis]
MASSSGKRLKTMATKRKEKEPEQPHSSRFLSRKHEKHFRVVQDRRLLMERKVGMIPNFAPQFGEQVLGNDWGKLATYPAPANIAVAAQPVPPRRARRERGPAQSQTSAETHEAEPFQMRDMYMSLIGAQLQSIHKGQVATTEMIVGMYDTPPAHRWTMDEFHNVVAWPEEPVQGGGAEAAEASVREMERYCDCDIEQDVYVKCE